MIIQIPQGPAESLAGRLRGRLDAVNSKMRRIRSRSMEKLKGGKKGANSEVIGDFGVSSEGHGEWFEASNDYSGPYLGQARAVVDCVPSPYDREALGFSKGDIIDIISMNEGGRWRGHCRGRMGHFKFVNVEILPPRRRSRSRSLRRLKQKPSNLVEVMKVLNMQEFTSVFVLNGYENLTLFKDLDDEELDYLGINNEKQREKLIAMAELLFPVKSVTEIYDDGEDRSEYGVADSASDSSGLSDPTIRSTVVKSMQ